MTMEDASEHSSDSNTADARQLSPYSRSLIASLHLSQHPEGGWYVRDWQSQTPVGSKNRPIGSLIYFLLPAGESSQWHQVDADEIWLWHGPSPLKLQLGGDGFEPDPNAAESPVITLGSAKPCVDQNSLKQNSRQQFHHASTHHNSTHHNSGEYHFVIPAGQWQRTLPIDGDCLVSCVVAPGFTFEGFNLAADASR